MENEKRLIEVNLLRERIAKNFINYADDATPEQVAFNEAIAVAIDELDSQPVVDAVELVRCKGCKSWKETYKDDILNMQFGKCKSMDSPYRWEEDNVTENDFCSYAERKEEVGE